MYRNGVSVHVLLSLVQDYHSLLFGSGRSLGSLATNVSHSLCLPISLQEVLDVNQSESVEVCGCNGV